MIPFSDEQLLAAVRAALTSEALPLDSGVRGRILDARHRGERVILPSEKSEPALSSRLSWALLAAALIGVAGVSSLWMARGRSVIADNTDIFASNGLLSTAYAQSLPARHAPAAPPLKEVAGGRLHVGRLEFAERWTDVSGRTRVDARIALIIEPVVEQGVPAWRASTFWKSDTTTSAETLFVTKDDLRPLRRMVHVSPYSRYSRINISQHFRVDSMLGSMSAEMNGNVSVRRDIAQKLPGAFAPFTTEGLAPAFLASVDLAPGWRRSISLLGWGVRNTDIYASVDLRVVGQDRVIVPAGEFDCWKLELRAGDHVVTHWARKTDGLGVMTRDEAKHATRGTRDIVLTREQPPFLPTLHVP